MFQSHRAADLIIDSRFFGILPNRLAILWFIDSHLIGPNICTAIAEPTNAATRVHAATGQSSSPGDLLVLLLAPADRHLAKMLKFLGKIH